MKNPAIPLLQQLIRNKCVNTGETDSGNEIVSARTLQEFFNGYGIESQILESRKGRANLLVKIEGKDSACPSLMYMGHMDVVDANRENWSFDPFGGEIINDHVCGRGAIDMLNMTSAMAAGMAGYCGMHGQPQGDLYYLAVADEEAAGKWGAQWLTEKHWDKVRCDFMITELGGFSVGSGKARKIGITVAEKGVSRYRLKTTGKAAHGSMPYKADNALVKIAEIAAAIGRMEPVLEPVDAYREMVTSLIDDSGLAGKLMDPSKAAKALAALSDPGLARFLHAAGRMTVSPTILSSGNKDNIIPDAGELVIDVRSLPGYGKEEIIAAIIASLGPVQADLEIIQSEFFPANQSSMKTPLYRAIACMAEQEHDTATAAPLFISSVSDGRFWRQKGTQVYGFCMFDEEMTMDRFSAMLHGTDEQISLNSMDKAFAFFRDLPDIFYKKIKE
ncbi:MAG: M20/M25/M40 family metallo-hydrolase [Spirochaetales bacterium]|nr:M20/M25/M40 family metallo-hydrolase [Spirochaetales bacterium]